MIKDQTEKKKNRREKKKWKRQGRNNLAVVYTPGQNTNARGNLSEPSKEHVER